MPKISDEKRAVRRAQILAAAWGCFQRQGLHATTMGDIIRASDLSAGAVYSYFPSKEDLILAAVTTSLGNLRELVAPLFTVRPSPPPGELVRQIAGLVAGYSVQETYDLRRIALLGWSEAQRNERLREIMRDYYLGFRGRLEDVAAQWREEGVLPGNASAPDVAQTILSVILGFVVQSAILGDVAPEALSRGLRGLTVREDPRANS